MKASTSGGDAERQLATFIRKFSPIDQRLIRAVRNALRNRFPTANELVYDNYNFWSFRTFRGFQRILLIRGAACAGPAHGWGACSAAG